MLNATFVLMGHPVPCGLEDPNLDDCKRCHWKQCHCKRADLCHTAISHKNVKANLGQDHAPDATVLLDRGDLSRGPTLLRREHGLRTIECGFTHYW